jgi:hypothetical protein
MYLAGSKQRPEQHSRYVGGRHYGLRLGRLYSSFIVQPFDCVCIAGTSQFGWAASAGFLTIALKLKPSNSSTASGGSGLQGTPNRRKFEINPLA